MCVWGTGSNGLFMSRYFIEILLRHSSPELKHEHQCQSLVLSLSISVSKLKSGEASAARNKHLLDYR